MARGRRDGAKILLYSHDTFGLGHLRRSMTIAHSLVERHKRLSALIVTGSPIIGAFDFRSRVDFVRVPGVIKLRNGNYTALNLHIDINETIGLRRAIIERTAEVFDPDLVIVDKEPSGLHGEFAGALDLLKTRGARIVLGLRDVLDEPKVLRKEWRRKRAMQTIEATYDEIWVYGHRALYEPLTGLKVSESVREKIVYTGYLPRALAKTAANHHWPSITEQDFLLVMTGGGGDGAELVDWILQTYEARRDLPWPALIVLGPFMPLEQREAFHERAEKLRDVEVMVFHNQVEHLVQRARAVVCMGGYNTFCEVLTYDKPALIVPRTHPRQEQLIRASRAEALGLARMLLGTDSVGNYVADIDAMAEALGALADQPPPSARMLPDLMAGLESVNAQVTPWINGRYGDSVRGSDGPFCGSGSNPDTAGDGLQRLSAAG
ncbi:glycosyltransferase family protein [Rhodoligotrophos ferricapiens]|uniref:glycosyltransferase family protein n=1 Tax=Rhodoligotrophos ferricapiens TaxID=3069264 RepID=UPI00315D1888